MMVDKTVLVVTNGLGVLKEFLVTHALENFLLHMNISGVDENWEVIIYHFTLIIAMGVEEDLVALGILLALHRKLFDLVGYLGVYFT